MTVKATKLPLSFIKYTPSDFDAYYSLVKNDEVMRYISGKGLTEDGARTKFDSMLKLNEAGIDIGYYKVYNAESVWIGDAKLEWYRKDKNVLEVGYILSPEFWGMGYASEICARLLAFAQAMAPTKDVIGIIDPDNVASKRVLEKFGFKTYFIGTEDGLATEKLRLTYK